GGRGGGGGGGRGGGRRGACAWVLLSRFACLHRAEAAGSLASLGVRLSVGHLARGDGLRRCPTEAGHLGRECGGVGQKSDTSGRSAGGVRPKSDTSGLPLRSGHGA